MTYRHIGETIFFIWEIKHNSVFLQYILTLIIFTLTKQNYGDDNSFMVCYGSGTGRHENFKVNCEYYVTLILDFSYYFCLIIEGSRIRTSYYWIRTSRPKNMRIWIRNTVLCHLLSGGRWGRDARCERCPGSYARLLRSGYRRRLERYVGTNLFMTVSQKIKSFFVFVNLSLFKSKS